MQKAIVFKVKDGKKTKWVDWCTELRTTLLNEAVLTIEEEKVLQELVLGFTLKNEYYVIGYMDGECLPANMDKEINKKHKLMKTECLERVDDADVLYNLKASGD